MNKKIISLVLALVMVLGTFTSVFAEPAKKDEAKKAEPEKKVEKIVGKQNKIQYIIDMKLVEGYEDGNYGFDKNIKRSEITRLLVLANGNEDLAKKLQGAMKIYTDVDTKHWANGVISVGTTVPSDANGIAMLVGYPDGSFGPERDVTYAELAKMLVVLAKKDLTPEMVKNAKWATSWMTWAAELGILDDVTITDSNLPANRADAFTMVYNALYSMKYFKRTPANETMGILSQLKNNELTLNQGEKAKTFKITNSTVFVLYNQHNTLDANANVKSAVKTLNNAVKVSAITNPSYYYGSLVRVIADKDGNVTHILELGNPRNLALGHKDDMIHQHTTIAENTISPNNRWKDVADATVETSTVRDLLDLLNIPNRTRTNSVAAKIDYRNGNAKSISFYEGMFSRVPANETGVERYNNNFVANDANKFVELKLTNSTRYFVADVVRNQLTEVNNVDEAIRILGNTTASNWFFDVYAGYNEFGTRAARETSRNTAIAGYNEATVVVFNSVQKDNNNSQLLRVTNETNSKYDITFENTKGEKVDLNLVAYRNNFPFNFNSINDSAKLDVVEYTVNNAYGLEAEMKIDHSKTDKYPIVKVMDIQNGGRTLIVKGEYNETAVLRLASGYDTFIEGQLKVGALIQFHTLSDNVRTNKVNDTNVVDIVSVMPNDRDFAVKGSLRNVVEGNLENQAAGLVRQDQITKYRVNGFQKVVVSQFRDLYNADAYRFNPYYILNDDEANALRAWLEDKTNKTDEIRFQIRINGQDKDAEIYNIEVLKNGNWVDLTTLGLPEAGAKNDIAHVKTLINALVAKYDKEACPANLEQAKADVKAVKDAIAGLTDVGEKASWANPANYKAWKDALKAVEDKIAECENKAAVAKVQAEADKLMKAEDIAKLTEQDKVNKAAADYNVVANAYNALSADAKKLTEAGTLKTLLNGMETAITTVDGNVEPSVTVTPAVVKAA